MRDISVLAQKAASQHGLLSTSQLVSALGAAGPENLLRQGFIERATRGVYRFAGSPVGWHSELMAACLASDRLVVASHRSAQTLWGFRTVDDELEVTIRYPFKLSVPGVIVHRIRDLTEHDFTFIEGIPVTTPARTLCDAGLIFPDHEIERMVEHALAKGVLEVEDLRRFRCRVGRKGRNGVGAIDRVLAALPPCISKAESGPEIRLAKICRNAGLPEPVAQHPVVARGCRYRLDFAYPESRLAIEYDEFDEHTRPETFVSDRRRQNNLQYTGWNILRFSWADLRDRPDAVAAEIRKMLLL